MQNIIAKYARNKTPNNANKVHALFQIVTERVKNE
jgi:hypothetical protein